jgi:hypothetical protein
LRLENVRELVKSSFADDADDKDDKDDDMCVTANERIQTNSIVIAPFARAARDGSTRDARTDRSFDRSNAAAARNEIRHGTNERLTTRRA